MMGAHSTSITEVDGLLCPDMGRPRFRRPSADPRALRSLSPSRFLDVLRTLLDVHIALVRCDTSVLPLFPSRSSVFPCTALYTTPSNDTWSLRLCAHLLCCDSACMAPLTLRQRSLVVAGLGRHFVSPARRSRYVRKSDKYKVLTLGKALRMQHLARQLGRLQAATMVSSTESNSDPVLLSNADSRHEAMDMEVDVATAEVDQAASLPAGPTPVKKARRRVLAEERKKSLYIRWRALLPFLQQPLLEYMQETSRRTVPNKFCNRSICATVDCKKSTRWVTMLCWDRKYSLFCVLMPLILCEQTLRAITWTTVAVVHWLWCWSEVGCFPLRPQIRRWQCPLTSWISTMSYSNALVTLSLPWLGL